jgi:chromosome segregation ATPase
MNEKKGHFEKGLWVEDREPSVPQVNEDAIDRRLTEATKAVISSIDTVMSVTHDLVATEEGKQFIETTIKETQKQIELSFNAIISRAKAELDKTKAGLDKTKTELDKKVAELDKKVPEPEKIKAEVDKKVAELNKRITELKVTATEPEKPKAGPVISRAAAAETKARPAPAEPRPAKAKDCLIFCSTKRIVVP